MSEKDFKKLMVYSQQCATLTKAKVYESDSEVSDSIRKVSNTARSKKRYANYTFAVKKA